MTYHPDRRKRLGECLKAARKQAGLSATKAALLLQSKGLRCSRGTVLAWERGLGHTSREPFSSDLRLIAEAYACTVDDFFKDCTAAKATPEQNGEWSG